MALCCQSVASQSSTTNEELPGAAETSTTEDLSVVKKKCLKKQQKKAQLKAQLEAKLSSVVPMWFLLLGQLQMAAVGHCPQIFKGPGWVLTALVVAPTVTGLRLATVPTATLFTDKQLQWLAQLGVVAPTQSAPVQGQFPLWDANHGGGGPLLPAHP